VSRSASWRTRQPSTSGASTPIAASTSLTRSTFGNPGPRVAAAIVDLPQPELVHFVGAKQSRVPQDALLREDLYVVSHIDDGRSAPGNILRLLGLTETEERVIVLV
jgi:hypothetical protein